MLTHSVGIISHLIMGNHLCCRAPSEDAQQRAQHNPKKSVHGEPYRI